MRSFLSGLVVGVVSLIMSIFLNETDKISMPY
ncbi:hypothetical protein SAMN05443529_12357 [Desulfosporosinus hippei DSM 8344]|uniref:Uncharacterized protein n=1 Tax=Desulfosporosinus hippei DSM 8344 TaxID=1121419 RepID=A0A1G8GTY7_9FIRM|nr:hypothetical protein SAMN05443529_12357 [Desulfosporosinus hippei DSM 8344]